MSMTKHGMLRYLGRKPCLFCGSKHSDGVWHRTGAMKEDLYVCCRCATSEVLPKLVADAIMAFP
jgi:hypothetical protein